MIARGTPVKRSSMKKEKRRLKTLFLPSWYPSEENRVAGVFVREHAQAVALYNDVTVLYNEGVGEHIKGLYKTVSDKIENGIRTIRIRHKKSPIPKTSYFIYLWSVFKGFRKLMRGGWRPDIIHAHVYFAGVPAVILGKIYKMPVVITEHWSGFPRHILGKLDIFKARFAMNRAKILLPVSQDLKESIESYGIQNRFQVIPNVINTEIFYPSTSQYRNEKKRILLVALLSPAKGISYLLQALAQLKEKRQDFVLDIVGDGPNRQEYEELTRKLELGEVVRFHGLKSKPEVAEYMRQCDFFIQPSLFETFGVTYIEAMACGKPIVATTLPVLQEKISKDRGSLVPPESSNALSEVIEYMLDHYQNYSSVNISKYVKENFSYEVVGNKLNSIYREIVYKRLQNKQMKEELSVKEQIVIKDSLWSRFGRKMTYFLFGYPFRGSGKLINLVSKTFIPRPKGPRVVHTIYGFDIICMDPVNDKGVEKPLYLTGTYEAGTLSVMGRCLREGDTFIDVGANIGLMSIFSSRAIGNKGRVYSFEPVLETFTILKKNIELNKITNIDAFNIGVSDSKGKSFIYTNPYAGKGSSSFIKPPGQNESKEHEIIVETLDELSIRHRLTNIRMLKIDVEGWELHVLRGAETLLRSPQAPIICIEYSKLTGSNNDSEDIYSYIIEINNYLIYKLEKGKGMSSKLVGIKDASEVPHHDNLFCFLPEHLKSLPKSLVN